MKHIKRLLLLLNILIVPQIIVAQYRFTVSFSLNCNCHGNYECEKTVREINASIQGYLSTYNVAFNNLNDCETARAIVNSIPNYYKQYSGYCNIKFTTTPCSGFGDNGNFIILGPSHGKSFFSPNFANEVKYWSEDDIKKSILNNDFQIPQLQSLKTNDPDYDNERAIIKENGFIIDTDKPFRSLNIDEKGGINTHSSDFITPKTIPANEKLVMTYLNQVNRETAPSIIDSEQYINWVKEQFNKILKCDDCIEEIIHKISRTKEESEILRNYREFEKHLLYEAISSIDKIILSIRKSKEKKEMDMAILALDSYDKNLPEGGKNNSKNYLFLTDYERVDVNSPNISNSIKGLTEEIANLNGKNNETGFNAVLYYNKITNEYTIAFEGSSMPEIKLKHTFDPTAFVPSVKYDINKNEFVVRAFNMEVVRISQDFWNDWLNNNGLQAIGIAGSQFYAARHLGEYINNQFEVDDNNIKINFTGHSLGGALASIAGLITGKPTYTYNAEGVSDKILKEFDLLEKKQNNEFEITAYHTDNDILTIIQNSSQNLSKITIDPEDDKNNYISNAIGTVINIGNINQPSPINSKAVKYTAITPDMKLRLLIENCKAHKMEPVVKYFLNKNKSTQEYWQQLTDSQNNMNREIGNTRMRSYEQIYITTNE